MEHIIKLRSYSFPVTRCFLVASDNAVSHVAKGACRSCSVRGIYEKVRTGFISSSLVGLYSESNRLFFFANGFVYDVSDDCTRADIVALSRCKRELKIKSNNRLLVSVRFFSRQVRPELDGSFMFEVMHWLTSRSSKQAFVSYVSSLT